MPTKEKVLIIAGCVLVGLVLIVGLVRFCTTNPDMRYDSNPYDLTDEFEYKPWYVVIRAIFRSIFWRFWW